MIYYGITKEHHCVPDGRVIKINNAINRCYNNDTIVVSTFGNEACRTINYDIFHVWQRRL